MHRRPFYYDLARNRWHGFGLVLIPFTMYFSKRPPLHVQGMLHASVSQKAANQYVFLPVASQVDSYIELGKVRARCSAPNFKTVNTQGFGLLCFLLAMSQMGMLSCRGTQHDISFGFPFKTTKEGVPSKEHHTKFYPFAKCFPCGTHDTLKGNRNRAPPKKGSRLKKGAANWLGTLGTSFSTFVTIGS